MKSEYRGNILDARALEDSIRATRKYTKGAFSRARDTGPIQGDGFASRTLTEYYEVYPDTELSWEMPASDFWAWVWGDVPHIEVRFRYDYRGNRAEVTVYGGTKAVKELARGIPGFDSGLAKLEPMETHERKQEPVVEHPDRIGARPIAHP